MTARDELNNLLDTAMRQALSQVQTQGKHESFALGIDAGGEQVAIGADVPTLLDPQTRHARISERVAEAIATGRVRAVAVVRNISLTHTPSGKQADAVEIVLDHRDDTAVRCYMPYQFRQGKFNTAQLVATPAPEPLFPHGG
ncbi:MAG: hypothetical protein IT480_16570 [Gammaproteobacteria bacterium]|nr:hypothetical protein [Gammaproteobacteria bacterium]